MKPRACILLRKDLHYRLDAFCAGLEALGYACHTALPAHPKPSDVLVIWNRYRGFDEPAEVFERAGARVIVAENGYLGKSWRGGNWYALALSQHNGAGHWPTIPDRWDNWHVELAPWRALPDRALRVLILGQRGIGNAVTSSPKHWDAHTFAKLAPFSRSVEVRQHPGKSPDDTELEAACARADVVATWGSGAALKALAFGVPVVYEFKQWIGARASVPLERHIATSGRYTVEDRRLDMFRALAGALWHIEEISSGKALAEVLSCVK